MSSHIKVSHISLKRRFNTFNKKYFDNRLPKTMVVIWHPCDGAYAKSWPQEELIWIDTSLQGMSEIVDIKLIHEMNHCDLKRANHGKVFDGGIDRLYALGAFRGLL